MPIIGFLICAGLLAYPLISSLWNQYRSSQVIATYEQSLPDKNVWEEELKRAEQYNQRIRGTLITDAEFEKESEYEALLNPNSNGMMGYIEIPSIDVKEPIFHYSTDEVLQEGIGHIHGSSLPVGGASTHSVLTGHRGLPSSKMFTDLGKVKEGNTFYIHVLGETLAYKVDQIQTVLPEEVDSLVIEDQKDLVTLVTCTPFGINTHRLLVTGHRVPYNPENGDVKEKTHHPISPALIVLLVLCAWMAIVVIYRKKKN